MEKLGLVEVSFEVANKVGGIHQVLKSKNAEMTDIYNDAYLTVGPYKQKDEFVPRENPFPEISETLQEEGIEIYYGVWNVEGHPKTVLVDASNLEKDINELKEHYWKEYGIDSLNAGNDFDEPVKWGYAVSRLVQELEKDHEFVLHLHEWLSAVPALHTGSPTVFTAHATVMGRALSNQGLDLVSIIENEQEFEVLPGVRAKHDLERAAAEQSDVFTTVSKTTAEEASKILGVKPDMVLPNGLNIRDYPDLAELSVNHVEKKQKMKKFVKAYFESYYSVNLEDDPRFFFTSGRFEYYNKGFDVLIEALSKVNEKPGKEIYFFFFVPGDVKGPNPEVLENKSVYEELEDYIDSKMPSIREKLLDAAVSGKEISQLPWNFDELERLEVLQSRFQRTGQKPPINAFELNRENKILEALKQKGLDNNEENRVKVVLYPTYLSFGDRLLSMDYRDAVVASSAGFFPSYYEPWGYTPVETAANGVLAVTSDLAGFGQYMLENADLTESGIKVLERKDRPREEVIEDLADVIDEFSSYNKSEITERKHNARKLAQLTSWDKLIGKYEEAHEQARRAKR